MAALRTESGVFALAGHSIRDLGRGVALQSVDRQLEASPGMRAYVFGDRYEKSVEDASHHLSALTQALLVDEPTLFVSYVIWVEVVLSSLGLPEGCLAGSLAAIRETLVEELPVALPGAAVEYLDTSLVALSETSGELPTGLSQDGPLAVVARGYLEALLGGDRWAAAEIVGEAVASGAILPDVYEQVFRASLHEVGRMWESNRLSVAMEHYATGATEAIMLRLSPAAASDPPRNNRFLGACVQGERHDMAIRMVCEVLRADGWDTFFLGADTPESVLARAIDEFRPAVVGLSATWLFNVDSLRGAVQRINQTHSEVKVIVGGGRSIGSPDWQRRWAPTRAGSAWPGCRFSSGV